MKIALVQYNPGIGDISGNTRRILELYARAQAAGAELVVFSELALSGYPPHDLLKRKFFIRALTEGAHALAASVSDPPLVLGSAYADEGKLYNAVLVLAQGKIQHRVYKTHLSADAGFDEYRYFSDAAKHETALWQYKNERLAFTLSHFDTRGAGPETPPLPYSVAGESDKAATLIINLAAMPFYTGAAKKRRRMARYIARAYGCPFIHVAQAGGNDELVFDGGSLVAFPYKTPKAVIACARFAEDLCIADTRGVSVGDLHDGKVRPVSSLMHADGSDAATRPWQGNANAANAELAELRAGIVFGIREFVRKTGFEAALLGLSGGLDSALLAALAVEALGADKVLGVSMPSGYSSKGSVDDAYALARTLGIRICTLPIESLMKEYASVLAGVYAEFAPPGEAEKWSTAEENIQSRIRGVLLMALSNKFSYLLLNTGNKSECAVGYCTLYGDTNGAFAPLGDVYKTKIYQLARFINRDREIIPQACIDKPPSAELAPNQKDSDSLPPYDVLDAILKLCLEKGYDAGAITARGYAAEVVRSVMTLIERSEYKRKQAAPILHVSTKAFGSGRHVPLIGKQW
jgi:NAD+ synthase (glutamine-hydrolysing)